jgi:hypothetical protein
MQVNCDFKDEYKPKNTGLLEKGTNKKACVARQEGNPVLGRSSEKRSKVAYNNCPPLTTGW